MRAVLPAAGMLVVVLLAIPSRLPPRDSADEPERDPVPSAPDPAEKDEELYPMDRVLRKLQDKLKEGERVPMIADTARSLGRLVTETRTAVQNGASIQKAAETAVKNNPAAAEYMRTYPGARLYLDSEFAEYQRDEINAETPRDAAKARQRMRALEAIGRALGW